MKSDAPGRYVDNARDRMQSYVRQLMEDNEALRIGMAAMENENVRLQQEIGTLSAELTRTRTAQEQLQQKLQEIRGESEKRFAEYAKLETVNTNLANLYVASYQMHGTLDRQTVLAAIQEIIVNLVGSEEFAVFEREWGGQFRLAASVGMTPDQSILGHQRVAQATASGETWVSAQHGDLTACIPLKIDDRVTGLIVICRLLAHKTSLEPLDLELFDLLGTHAAMALHASTLHERFAQQEIPA
jgi:GAF domain-containing protein